MSSLDAKKLPPVFTPVFDANNHMAAIRVNHALDFQPDPGLLASMERVFADAAAGSFSSLPLLVETTKPAQWLNAFDSPKQSHKLHFLMPASCVDNVAMQTRADGVVPNNVVLIVSGLPDSNKPLQALGFNAAQSLDGCQTALLKKFPGPHLATNIASHATHRQCRSIGFHWFEGCWPLQQDGGQDAQCTTPRSTLLNLLGLVAGDADSHEMEALFKRDPNLSYQLLKLVNSVSFSLTHKITNFKQAITLLGRRQLQRWLQLLLYAGHHGPGGASALLSFVARRAAFMEGAIAARSGKQDEKDRAFMIGMFSLLDVLFRAPIADLVVPLNLHDDITNALVAHEGTLGQLLELAITTESNIADNDLCQSLEALAISPATFIEIQLKALAWAAQVSGEMG